MLSYTIAERGEGEEQARQVPPVVVPGEEQGVQEGEQEFMQSTTVRVRFAQLVPSHSHVSPPPGVPEQNGHATSAIKCHRMLERAEGLPSPSGSVGVTIVQVWPFHSHVSSKRYRTAIS